MWTGPYIETPTCPSCHLLSNCINVIVKRYFPVVQVLKFALIVSLLRVCQHSAGLPLVLIKLLSRRQKFAVTDIMQSRSGGKARWISESPWSTWRCRCWISLATADFTLLTTELFCPRRGDGTLCDPYSLKIHFVQTFCHAFTKLILRHFPSNSNNSPTVENATSPVVAVRASQGSSSSDSSAPDSGVPLEEPRTPPLPEKQEAVNPSHKVMRTITCRLKVNTHAILL